MLYLSQSQFRDEKQYGFLAGESTQLQLLSAIDRETDIMDQGKDTDVIYLDIRKAYDRVPH